MVRVNNRDMLGTYKPGDALLIRKSFYTLERNDVIWFSYPLTDSVATKTYMLQRIYGLPGDTLQIIDKQVYINNVISEEPGNVRQNYFIKMICEPDSSFKAEFGLNEGGKVSDEFDYAYSLTREQALLLKEQPYVKSVEIRMEKAGSFDENCFPYHSTYVWNADQYGKIRIPRQGDTLKLDTNSVKLYQLLIKEHEKNSLEIRSDSIIINGELTNKYPVKKNYFFVLGDNRGNAVDSRQWGYLPENCISGKVAGSIRKMK